jgi:cyclic pyranopterin phosphate synthase
MISLSISRVKINAVIVRGWNDSEIVSFAKFARNTGHIVRYIEFMPLDGSGIWRPELVVSKKEILEKISQDITYLVPQTAEDNSDPAILYRFSDGSGIVGFIPSITEPFCGNCDRIRLTADGKFLTCLFENPGHDLRSLLRNGVSDAEIGRYIVKSMSKKPEGIIKTIRSKSLEPKMNIMHTIGG